MNMTSVISIKVVTNAPKNAVVGKMADGTIKIRIKAKPIQGKANDALISFLCEELQISKSRVMIVSGKRSQRKKVQIKGLANEEVVGILVKDCQDP